MHFIERYLGFAPDNGDGSLEAALLIALVTVIAGIGVAFFVRATRHQQKKRD